MSRMMSGSPILMGNNSVPGVKIHKEVRDVLPEVFRTCTEFGLDFYPTIIEFVTYDEISELASYGGFPVRYPHWSFGMEYEQLARGYEFGQHRISEMVINGNPCVIYCMDSNTLVSNINVIAHALGHNDFFKNNIFFSATNRGMMNKMANHGSRIRKYMSRWGKEAVTSFIDHCLRLDTLIDPAMAWKDRVIKEAVIRDERHYEFPDRLRPDHSYMDDWVNPLDRLEHQRESIREREAAQQIGLLEEPAKDIFGFLKDHAPLKPWQQDIISMLYEEALYFAPQRATKMANEGWASFTDFNIMCRQGLCSLGQKNDGAGIVEYSKHKMLVLGGKYSQNPYKVGYELFMDIEDRWNKGRFGQAYEDCQDMNEKENWDKKLGLGREKVFEVRKHYNDVLMIAEFFTADFCEKKEFFEYQRYPNGEWKIVSKDFHKIKRKLLQRYTNGGLPDVRLVDPNHRGKGWMLLQHQYDGLELYVPYVNETLTSLYRIWQNNIVLASRDSNNEEIIFLCKGPDLSSIVSYKRSSYEESFLT
jgi:stage V sporulation protein R